MYLIMICQERFFETIVWLEDLVVTNEEGNALLFMDFDSADYYRGEHFIDGKIVEIPTY